eukprot:TRINITY_DN14453_c0_g1_i1.p1 TRINITY_DN14453_c0_g1~~TRINITY_DN14453_c0_g1_i1.p1  ORF type:complete len:190 (-),score=21.45 TRINITY_DN14453_c0_g1_i1:151-720(-)
MCIRDRSKELEEVAHGVLTNTVPSVWCNQICVNSKPLYSWIKDIKRRAEFLKNWIDESYPTEYLPGLFSNPRHFLSALKLNHARKKKLPVDTVVFEYKFTDNPIRSDKGKYLSGLLIEGAKWQSACIAELEAGSTIAQMPSVLFIPTIASKAKKPSHVFFIITIELCVSGVRSIKKYHKRNSQQLGVLH